MMRNESCGRRVPNTKAAGKGVEEVTRKVSRTRCRKGQDGKQGDTTKPLDRQKREKERKRRKIRRQRKLKATEKTIRRRGGKP